MRGWRVRVQEVGQWENVGVRPIKFRVVSFQPVGAEDDIVGGQGGDVEFGAFLVILVVRRGDS